MTQNIVHHVKLKRMCTLQLCSETGRSRWLTALFGRSKVIDFFFLVCFELLLRDKFKLNAESFVIIHICSHDIYLCNTILSFFSFFAFGLMRLSVALEPVLGLALVDQAGLKLRDLPSSALLSAGIKGVCHHHLAVYAKQFNGIGSVKVKQ